MTEAGTRWSGRIPVPPAGQRARYFAVQYKDTVRFVPVASFATANDVWFKPLYAIRVEAKNPIA